MIIHARLFLVHEYRNLDIEVEEGMTLKEFFDYVKHDPDIYTIRLNGHAIRSRRTSLPREEYDIILDTPLSDGSSVEFSPTQVLYN